MNNDPRVITTMYIDCHLIRTNGVHWDDYNKAWALAAWAEYVRIFPEIKDQGDHRIWVYCTILWNGLF